jgi:hypothetical protein
MNDEAATSDDDDTNGWGSAERTLARDSDRLLDAVDRLRTLEIQKRAEVVSTPEFHHLAEAVEQESRRIFSLANEQEEIGDRPDVSGFRIDDVAESEDGPGA